MQRVPDVVDLISSDPPEIPAPIDVPDDVIEILSSSAPRSPPSPPRSPHAHLSPSRLSQLRTPPGSKRVRSLISSSPGLEFNPSRPKALKSPASAYQALTAYQTPGVVDLLSSPTPAEADLPPTSPIHQLSIKPKAFKSSVEPKKTSTKRPKFKSAELAGRTTSAVAAPVVTDRIKASSKLTCVLRTEDDDWKSRLEQEFTELEAKITCVRQPLSTIEGVRLMISVIGKYDDEWDEELEVFVKGTIHEEKMKESLVVLDAIQLDVLGKMSFDARAAYFHQIELLSGSAKVVYMIPEVGAHYKKLVDKFNRDMRRRVATDSNTYVSEVRLSPPPDEHFYIQIQTELQIMHEIRTYYPRKIKDAAEMLANCVIDMGFTRYRRSDESIGSIGGPVKSKLNPTDVTIEALTKIQGLPPRIAAKLGSEAQTLGRIASFLGTNRQMRESRIKRFGQGTWNQSLLSFLEDEDPFKVI